MPDQELLGLATKAQISGHPLHPMLVPLPIGFLAGMFVSDLAYWATTDQFWADVAFWALLAGIVSAAVAAIAGFMDFLGNERIRAIPDARRHVIGNLVVVVLALVSLWLRWSTNSSAVLPWGLLISAIIAVLLLYTAWKGGEVVYRHRVGMQPDETSR